MHRRTTASLLTALLVVGLTGPLTAAPAGAAAGSGSDSGSGVNVVRPILGFSAAWAASVKDPAASPPGVNPASCTLTPEHPRPVLLVNGTFETMLTSFGYLGPSLANAGWCVYGYNYGGDPRSPIQSLAPLRESVARLAAEVEAVKQRTGAAEVELIGFSQGGLLAEHYTKFGGASSVNSVTAIAPTTNGTTLLGIATLARQIPGALPLLRAGGCPACADQVRGSAFVRQLNDGTPIAQPGVTYGVVDTVLEDVVTPAGSSFIREPVVVNRFVQQDTTLDTSEHLDLPFDPATLRFVERTLQRAAG